MAYYQPAQYTRAQYAKSRYTPTEYYQTRDILRKSTLADYNDPTEINSLADALFNLRAQSRLFPKAKWVPYVFPWLSSLAAISKLTIDKGIKPILQGQFKEAALNGLMNISETLDILANPVKGIFLEKEGPIKGFINGLGVGKAGRVNYDYDTGSKVLDMGLEVISDPLNWVSFGGKALISTGAKQSAAAFTKGLTKEVGEDVLKKSAQETTQRVLAKTFRNLDKYNLDQATEQLLKKSIRAGDIAVQRVNQTSLLKDTVDTAVARILKLPKTAASLSSTEKSLNRVVTDVKDFFATKNVSKALRDIPDAKRLATKQALIEQERSRITKILLRNVKEGADLEKVLQYVQNYNLDELALNINLSLQKPQISLIKSSLAKGTTEQLMRTADVLERNLLRSALLTSSSGLGYTAFKIAGQPVAEYVSKQVMQRLRTKNLINKQGVIDLKRYTQARIEYLSKSTSYEIFEDTVAVRNSAQFNKLVQTQLTQDKDAILGLLIENADEPYRLALSLKQYLMSRYNMSNLQEYADALKAVEVDAQVPDLQLILKQVQETLQDAQRGLSSKTNIETLFKVRNKTEQKALAEFGEQIKQYRSPKEPTKIKYYSDTVYRTLKYNNTQQNYEIFKAFDQNQILQSILSTEDGTLGAFFNNLLEAGIAPEADANLKVLASTIQDIKTYAKTTSNYKTLYNWIAQIKTSIDTGTEIRIKSALLESLDEFKGNSVTSFLDNYDAYFKQIISNAETLSGTKIPIDIQARFNSILHKYVDLQVHSDLPRMFTTEAEAFLTATNRFMNLLPANKIQDPVIAGIIKQYDDSFKKLKKILAKIKTANENKLLSYAYPVLFEDQKEVLREALDAVVGQPYRGIRETAYKTYVNTTNFKGFFNEEVLTSLEGLEATDLKNMAQLADKMEQYTTRYNKVLTEKMQLFELKPQINAAYQRFLKVRDAYFLRNRAPEYLTYMKEISDEDYIGQFTQLQLLDNWVPAYAYTNIRPMQGGRQATNYSLGDLRLQELIEQGFKYPKTPTPLYIKGQFNLNLSETQQESLEYLSEVQYLRTQAANPQTFEERAAIFNKEHQGRLVSRLYTKEAETLQKTKDAFAGIKKDIDDLYDKEAEQAIFDKLTEQIKFFEANGNSSAQQVVTDLRLLYTQYITDASVLSEEDLRALYRGFKNFNEYAHTNLDMDAPFKKQLEYIKTLKNKSKVRMQNITNELLTLSPEALRSELIYNHGIIAFDAQDAHTLMRAQQLKKALKGENNTDIKVVIKDNVVYLVLDRNSIDYTVKDGEYLYKGKRVLKRLRNTSDTEQFGKDFQDISKSLKQLTGSSVEGTDGSTLTKDTFEAFYDALPEEVKKLLPNKSVLLNDEEFKQNIFNGSILGSTEFRRRFNTYASDFYTSLKTSVQTAERYTNTRLEYIQAGMDPLFGIGQTGVFSHFSDSELFEALKRHPEYKLAVLHETKSGKVELMGIPITSVHAITRARQLNAQILPDEIFKDMYNNINKRIGSSGFLQKWQKLQYIYKTGYLVNFGTIARNVVDTTLKTIQELGVQDGMRYLYTAFQRYKTWREISKTIAEDYKYITTDIINEVFKTGRFKNIAMSKEEYNFWWEFFKYGPITNITQDAQVLGRKVKILDEDLWKTYTNLADCLLRPSDLYERINRMAMYLHDVELGYTKSEAWYHISKTHFDYAFRNKAEQLGEAIFPFITFTARNMRYWANYMTEHPEMASLYRDILTPILDIDAYSQQELAQSRGVQSQILNGNVRLFSTATKDIYIRPGISVLDTVQNMMTPLHSLIEKLNQPMAAVFNFALNHEMPTTALIPIYGAYKQRLDKSEREQNILPSFVTVKQRHQPKRRAYARTPFIPENPRAKALFETTQNGRRPKMQNNAIYDGYSNAGVAAFRARAIPVNQYNVKAQLRQNINYLR